MNGSILVKCLVAAAACLPAFSVHAQAYPQRPVVLVVPTGPGGSLDITARQVAQYLVPMIGQPIVVENKAGGGATIGTTLVRNSARPGFLGPGCGAFRPDISKLFARELEPGMKNELAARGANHTVQLTLADGLTLDRLDDRKKLLAGFDHLRRDLDTTGALDGADKFQQQAFGGFFADARNLGEPAGILRAHRRMQIGHAQTRQHRQRRARAHAGDFQQLAKHRALLLGGKTVQQMRVFAHDQLREQRDVVTGQCQLARVVE